MTTTSAFLKFDQEALRRPHEAFADLRTHGSVVWVDEVQAYAVLGYAEATDVLRRPADFSSRAASGTVALARFNTLAVEVASKSGELASLVTSCPILSNDPVLISADPPVHTRHRALVNRTFTPSRVASLEEGIRALAHRLIDDFIGRGACEFVADFAAPLPLIVITDAFGLPHEDMHDLRRWSDATVAAVGNKDLSADDVETMLTSTVEFLLYLQAQATRRRECPRDDLIDRFIRAASAGGESFSDTELINVLTQFYIAGNETTTKLLTSGMALLLEEPGLLARLDAERQLIPAFIEEVLRLEPPMVSVFRRTTADVELSGVPIPADSDLWVLYAAANRDPAEFPEPDKIVLDRPNPLAHLSFSQGPHYCLGAALSRLEGRIAFEALLDRLADIAPSSANTFEYAPSYILHGLTALHLTFNKRKTT